MTTLCHSDTFRIPYAIEEGGRPRVRPHEADDARRYLCPACNSPVTTQTRKSRYFRHPVGAKTCNARSVIHPFAAERMQILLDGVNRGLLRLDFIEPRHPGEIRRHRYACPRGNATALNHHEERHNRYFDVVSLHNGRLVMVVEIRHKHDVDDEKRLHMPRPWIELPADRFTHLDIDAAVEAIGQGRQADALTLFALRRRDVRTGPPGDPDDPDDPEDPDQDGLLRRLRRYTSRVDRLRSSGSLDRGIVLLGETCPRHPYERLVCRIPRSAWTTDEPADPVHHGAHILLKRQSAVVLGILLVGMDSQINQIRGRRLATSTTIPLALIPVDQLRPLMKGIAVRLNSHAVDGPWSCSICEREAMEARIRARQDQQVVGISTEIETILQRHTRQVASLSLPPGARVDQDIEREVNRHLIGADDVVVDRVGWDWRNAARALQARHRARQQVVSEQTEAWRQLQAPLLRRIGELETRDELVALAQALAGVLPPHPEAPPDLAAAHTLVHIEGQAAISKRVELVTSPDWRMARAQRRMSQRYAEATSASDAHAILDAFAHEMRQIAGNHARRLEEAKAAIERERESFDRRCAWNAGQAVTRIASAWDAGLEKATSIESVERLLATTEQAIRHAGEQWRQPVEPSLVTMRQQMTGRIMELAPAAISAMARQRAATSVDADAIAMFRSDAAEWIGRFLQRISDASSEDRAVALQARLMQQLERETHGLLESQWHPRIWASWLPVRDDIKTRWGTPWGRRDRDRIEQFEALLRHNRIEPQWCPAPIRAACAITTTQATHWQIRRAIDEAQVAANRVGIPLEPPTGRQQTIF